MPESEIGAMETLLKKIEAIESVLQDSGRTFRHDPEAEENLPTWWISEVSIYRDGRKVIKVAYGIRRLANALGCSVVGQTIYKRSQTITRLWFEYGGVRFEENF
jgi:hypothetical protein